MAIKDKVNSRRRIIDFFRPTKRKLAVAFLLPIIIAVAVVSLMYLIYDIRMKSSEPEQRILIPVGESGDTDKSDMLADYLISNWSYLLIGIIIAAVYHYPLACFISGLVDTHKSGGFKGVFSLKNILILSLLVLIFNPFSLRLIQTIFLIYTAPQYDSCGLVIHNVAENGSFDRAGISKGEIIYEIYSDNWSALTYDHTILKNYVFPRLKPGDEVTVVTNKNTYVVKSGATPDGKPLFGMSVSISLCVCGDGNCENGEGYIFGKENIINENKEYYPYSEKYGCRKDCNGV